MTEPIKHIPITLSMIAQAEKKKRASMAVPETYAEPEETTAPPQNLPTPKAGRFKRYSANTVAYTLLGLVGITLGNTACDVVRGIYNFASKGFDPVPTLPNDEGVIRYIPPEREKISFAGEYEKKRDNLHLSILDSSLKLENVFNHNAKIAKYALPAVVRIDTERAMGSGFIFSKSGIILTCNHLIINKGDETAKDIEITFYNGEKRKASIIAQDPKTDLAALKIDPKDLVLPTLYLSNKMDDPGSSIIIIGHLKDYDWSTIPTTISASDRAYKEASGEIVFYIQLPNSTRSGCSGGPGLNARGEVIGIACRGSEVANTSLLATASTIYDFVNRNKLDK